MKFLGPLEFLSGSPGAGEKDLCCFIRGNKRNQTFACFNYKLDAASSTELEPDAVRKGKRNLGNRVSGGLDPACGLCSAHVFLFIYVQGLAGGTQHLRRALLFPACEIKLSW